jgi:hypothetical protein
MAIKVPCESCGKTLTAPDSAAGKRVRCPNCQAIQRLPEAPASDVMEPEPILEPEAYAPPPSDDPFEGMGAPSEPYGMVAEPPPYPGSVGSSGGGGGGEDRKPCPMCGEMIARTAMKCRFCNAIFDPKLQKLEYQRRRNMGGPGDDDLTGGEWVLAIICSGIGCIMGIVWMIQGKPKGKKMFFVSLGMTVLWNIIRFAAESARR